MTLSGGEQQRVALARCLLKPGDLILADEPTGSLDSHAVDLVLGLMQDLRAEEQVTVVIVTHDDHFNDTWKKDRRIYTGDS